MIEEKIEKLSILYSDFHKGLSDRIIGYDEIIKRMFISLMTEGNILLEGPPGVGKTSMVKTFAEYLGLGFSRIQFTPDIMPLDIIGSNILQPDEEGRRTYRFYPGPVFSNIVLGDEINRATPKTQSAFLEAMEEKKVTFLGTVHPLPSPFMVIATQNPIELEGTYPLPEAQIDRFFMKLYFGYPRFAALKQIIRRNETLQPGSFDPEPGNDLEGPEKNGEARGQGLAGRLRELQALEKEVVVIDDIRNFITRLVIATHPDQSDVAAVKKYVLYGASPRAGIALLRGVKWLALLDMRLNASFEDVQALAHDVLGHRILLNFDGEAENISSEGIIRRVLEQTGRNYHIG